MSAGGMMKKAKKAVAEEFDSMTRQANKPQAACRAGPLKGLLKKSSLKGAGF